MSCIIHWFREDLRISDNPALRAASVQQFPVVCLYIFENEDSLHAMKEPQKQWLHQSLVSLRSDLEKYRISLLIEKGNPISIWKKLIRKTNPEQVFWNRSYSPLAEERDEKIKEMLEKEGIEATICKSSLLLEPEEVKTNQGSYFKIFTPFYRAHKKICKLSPISPLPQKNKRNVRFSSLKIEDLKLLPKNASLDILQFWEIGERAAKKRLEDFLKTGLSTYLAKRDFPAINATSKLSPYLHFGEISPKQIALRISEQIKKKPSVRKNAEGFLRELIFRDFAYNLLHHVPFLTTRPFRPEFSRLKWKKNKKHLISWQQGITGYPLVDAGMRELYSTGWMHNRVRMVVASFLIKDLFIPWQEGERWFWQRLVDADLANNSFNWQWSAGCGPDAFPFFRVFNPMAQAKKYDPEGLYIKKWVPELAKLPIKYLFSPWEAPKEVLQKAGIQLGKTYPFPIVDHDETKKSILPAFRKMRKN